MCIKLEKGKHYPHSNLGWLILNILIILGIYLQNFISESDFNYDKECSNILASTCLNQMYKELLIVTFFISGYFIINKIYQNCPKIQRFINNL